jgi:predicted metal-dependent TIM-barrel fold hydrolase
MNKLFLYTLCLIIVSCATNEKRIIFDVHLHGSINPQEQLEALEANGVTTIAVSTSWTSQQSYKSKDELNILHGIMIPCPEGKVPYSLQPCFDHGKDLPEIAWVEQQIREKKIDFVGEVLTQYYGISSSDSIMFAYYALARKYNLPVGIHTGSAGPDHGSPNFKEEMGNPMLIKAALDSFPGLRVWIMHAGPPFEKECIALMKEYPHVYADISAMNNPSILPSEKFAETMKAMIEAGLEDRIMFGSDNADIKTVIASVENLEFISEDQKEKIFHKNADVFFGK